MGTKFLTQAQVRERYGNVSNMTIWRWIRAGRIKPPALYGNRNYFEEAELDEADRRAKAEYRRAQAEPPKHTPPHLQNSSK
ncbi:DNA-binding protein [Rhizobium sp. YTUHZ045]|uniref:helix-turn-helix domain-containing protein n=1 Tax=Rhizobium sp. YTUHZ045 TaxID=2962888 RepID=UPI003DAA00B3